MTGRDFSRINVFFDERAADIYEEVESDLHSNITRTIVEKFVEAKELRRGMLLLDVGCGCGYAERNFRPLGVTWFGITLGPDYAVCQAKNLPVEPIDQNFMPEKWSSRFDVVWARHVLEHSLIPFWTIHEYLRVLKLGGWAYVEVPQAATSCRHETNKNHYSVLPVDSWAALFLRAGFEIRQHWKIDLSVKPGPDQYLGFH